MTKRYCIFITALFCAFIGVFLVANAVSPDRTFSEVENRNLEQLPAVDFGTPEKLFRDGNFFNGQFMRDFETYTTDQFIGRDAWVDLKARTERALGKKENNNVYFADNDTLITRFDQPAADRVTENLNYVNKFVENVDIPVVFSLIPTQACIWADRLPEGAPNASQTDLMAQAQGAVTGATWADVYTPLMEHKDEDIFYRTDHHWTSLGAYYGLTALAESMGLPCPALDSYTDRHVVSEEFYGTTWSSSGFSWVKPDSMEIFVNAPEALKVTSYPEGSPVDGKLYDFSYLEKKDKYSMFMGGNCPLHEIVTGAEGKPSLLIIRDSYTDSLIPFLLEDYSEIHVLDLRYYRASLKAYIEQYDFDQVLVCYSVSNFSTDANIFLLGL